MCLIYGSLLNEKLYKDIEISDSLKNKHWKNKFLYEKKILAKDEVTILRAALIKNPIIQCQLCFVWKLPL